MPAISTAWHKLRPVKTAVAHTSDVFDNSSQTNTRALNLRQQADSAFFSNLFSL
jgi:hypothetical protein